MCEPEVRDPAVAVPDRLRVQHGISQVLDHTQDPLAVALGARASIWLAWTQGVRTQVREREKLTTERAAELANGLRPAHLHCANSEASPPNRQDRAGAGLPGSRHWDVVRFRAA